MHQLRWTRCAAAACVCARADPARVSTEGGHSISTRAHRPRCCSQLHDFFENIGDEQPPPAGADVSAEAWLRAKGASELQLELADVCYGNDFAASLRQLGVREMITENQRCVQ
jgi:hypothetical protein